MGDDDLRRPACVFSFLVCLVGLTCYEINPRSTLSIISNPRIVLASYVLFAVMIIGFILIANILDTRKAQKAISNLKLGDKIFYGELGEGTYIGPSEIKSFVKVQFPKGKIWNIDIFGMAAFINCAEEDGNAIS